MTDPVLPGKRVVKRFRVAREGQTVDGRSLSQQQIIDMSETYDPVEYSARINCEHMSGYWRDIDAARRGQCGVSRAGTFSAPEPGVFAARPA